jgi:hypothetical protein
VEESNACTWKATHKLEATRGELAAGARGGLTPSKCVAAPSEMLFVLLMLADLSRCGALMPAAPPPPGGLWDWTGRGDFRAVVTVSARVLQQAAGGPIAAVVEWRRRDADPEQKAIIVTDSAGQVLANVSAPQIEQHAGVIVFTPAAAGIYYVYYMPYTQSGIGGAHQKWTASTAGGGGDWQPAGNFSGKAAVHTRQDFVLPKPVTSKAFRWTCLRSWGSNPAWQAFVVELNFRTPTTGWLPNKATDTNPSPVTGASGWQPDVGPPPSGHPWQAMDGDITTIWDPQGSPSWLSVEFDEPVTIDAIGVLGYGAMDACCWQSCSSFSHMPGTGCPQTQVTLPTIFTCINSSASR